MADPSDIQIGAVVGGTYLITALLGRGGMGAVWSANHMRLPGKRVAIKVLHSTSQGDEGLARFRREAEIASRIGHPNIVEVLDWNVLPGGAPYLVLEYLDGESLGARLERGPIPLEETMLLVRQLGSALHAAHRAGVVHRDLKPDNIFLLPTDAGGHLAYRVKVLDFGISKIRSQVALTQESRVLGTPQYMAPEQATGKNQEVDERADVFALGAIVYQMLSGKLPFTGENLPAVIYQVVYEEPEPLASVAPGVPPQVAKAVHRAMSKKREDRPQDVLTFVEEVTGRPLDTLDRAAIRISKSSPQAFAPTEAQLAKGTPSPTVPPPPRRALGTVVKVLGVLAVAAVAATIAVVVTTRKGEPTLAVAGGGDAGHGGFAPALDAGGGHGDGGHGDAGRNGDASVPRAAAPDAAAAHAAPDAAATNAPPDAAPAPSPIPPPPRRPDAGLTIPPRPPTPPQPPPRPSPQPKPPPPPEPAEEEPEPPAAIAAELAQAERALVDGRYNEAIRLARHTLMDRKTGHAYSVIARAYCGLHDLGNAKAALMNVPPRGRPHVHRKCAQAGFPLH